MVDVVDPQARANERGNVLLLTLIIVLAMSALALGLNLLLKTTVNQEFLMQSIGDVPAQARNAASLGVNQLLLNLNTGASTTAACPAATPCASNTSNFPAPVLQSPNYAASYRVWFSSVGTGSPVVATVVAEGKIVGTIDQTPVSHIRLVSVGIRNNVGGTRWGADAATWKESE